MVHSTFAAACLFLIADLVITRRKVDTLTTRPTTVQNGLFAALFFAAAIAMAGMPPLSGFLGKLLVLDALRQPDLIVWAWSAVLVGSLFTIAGFARAGSILFWKPTALAPEQGDTDNAPTPSDAAGPLEVAPAMLGLAMLVGLAVFAGPVASYLEGTAEQLFDRAGYSSAVLQPNTGE